MKREERKNESCYKRLKAIKEKLEGFCGTKNNETKNQGGNADDDK